jgi:integrase/recombinase XerD
MLRRCLDEFVALRKATGFSFSSAEGILRSFVAFATARGDRRIRARTALRWASQPKKNPQRRKRLQEVIRFADYLRAEDPRHELPPRDAFPCRVSRPTPRVFTEDEVARIMAGAAELGRPESLIGKTYSTLFGLMATTGLRSSEAIGLRLGDVTEDGLVVRETKFRKSRLLPLHGTAAAALGHYIEARRSVSSDSDHVFISERHRGKLSRSVVLWTFHRVAQRAGIARGVSGGLPRVHDLRHTFAVRALERSPLGRDRVERHIVALTTYLGHARIESTYWYLEATPRLLRDIAAACEAVTSKRAS